MDFKTKPALQAIFFDFDGVIVDSTKTKTDAFYSLFIDYDTEIVNNILEYHRQHGGISRVEKIAYAHRNIIGSPLSDEDLSIWAARYSELVFEKVVGVDWVAGAKEFLDNKATDTPFFVISGTPEHELKQILDRRGMSGYFTEILGSPVRKPDHIRRLLRTYTLQACQCVFIGDALTDYSAAQETALHFIGIQGDVDFPQGTTVLKDCRRLKETVNDIFVETGLGGKHEKALSK